MNSNAHYIDLHIHSNCSDGVLSPVQVVERARAEGLETIAIADHDTVAGVAEAITAAAKCEIEVIPAVELSVSYKTWQDVHLLGYGIQYDDAVFLAKLNSFRERREHRNIKILSLVNMRLTEENRATIDLEEVLAYAHDSIGRPHIARALMKRHYVGSMEDAFRRYLVPCNVPKQYWAIEEAIAEIRRLGGLAILAHPTSMTVDRQELRLIVHELCELGLDGLEAYNNLAHADEMEFLRRTAGEMGLAVSAGSDFHGIEDGLEMGRGRGGIRFSAGLLAPLRERLLEREHQLLSR
ncbi:PHP domain-containing protein [Geobacter sp. SVR]|uniref:PHP domain-containing protein n=1 Tax=Geobacter sp. SVR TaxID=2495594 RepID=UPI001562FC66|nr:PHP domain-containing protein [Geobacter sp. SVR]